MADPDTPAKPKDAAPSDEPKDERTAPTPKKSDARTRSAKPAEKAAKPAKKEAPKAPRRPTLEPELARLLKVRDATDVRRPKFVRTASHRYWRIGRWISWRRPRGQQSKQRRHYGYRPVVVSIGFGSPRATRGLTPSGFRPVLVRTAEALNALDPVRDAVLIARTVGTRRRLVLEETARQKGLHVLNPIGRDREE
jgi:large subunit ribosomal protein L32e